MFGVLNGTGIFYLIFADGKIQPWNNPNEQIHLNGHNGHNSNYTENEKKNNEISLTKNF